MDEKDRDYIFFLFNGWALMPIISFIEKRVDLIYYCLKKLARINKEIKIN